MEYPDETSIGFFSGLFGTIQCLVFSLIMERDPSAWSLRPGIEITVILYTKKKVGLGEDPTCDMVLEQKGSVICRHVQANTEGNCSDREIYISRRYALPWQCYWRIDNSYWFLCCDVGSS